MKTLKVYYRDKIKELLKMCSVSGANALSTLVGEKETVPFSSTINLKPMDDLFMLKDDSIVIVSDISGDLSGVMIISFELLSGMKILNTMMGKDPEEIRDLSEDDFQALNEFMSLVGGSYLTEFGNNLDFKVMPQTPQFQGKFKEISSVLIDQLKAVNERILFINSSMNIPELESDVIFYVLFEENSFNMILNVLSKGADDPFEEK
jgi:chemotaxis protein CheY-P-specific phosphatase CheC